MPPTAKRQSVAPASMFKDVNLKSHTPLTKDEALNISCFYKRSFKVTIMLTVTLVGMAEKWNWTIGSRNQRGNQVWRQYKLLQQSFTKDWDDELFFFFSKATQLPCGKKGRVKHHGASPSSTVRVRWRSASTTVGTNTQRITEIIKQMTCLSTP